MIHKLLLQATETGKIIDGQPEYKKDMSIEGNEEVIFCLICELLHLNPKAKELIVHAVKFDLTHDHENCVWCNEAKKN